MNVIAFRKEEEGSEMEDPMQRTGYLLTQITGRERERVWHMGSSTRRTLCKEARKGSRQKDKVVVFGIKSETRDSRGP